MHFTGQPARDYGPALTACNSQREVSRKPWLEGPARTQPTVILALILAAASKGRRWMTPHLDFDGVLGCARPHDVIGDFASGAPRSRLNFDLLPPDAAARASSSEVHAEEWRLISPRLLKWARVLRMPASRRVFYAGADNVSFPRRGRNKTPAGRNRFPRRAKTSGNRRWIQIHHQIKAAKAHDRGPS
jgi:hypothetical protein